MNIGITLKKDDKLFKANNEYFSNGHYLFHKTFVTDFPGAIEEREIEGIEDKLIGTLKDATEIFPTHFLYESGRVLARRFKDSFGESIWVDEKYYKLISKSTIQTRFYMTEHNKAIICMFDDTFLGLLMPFQVKEQY